MSTVVPTRLLFLVVFLLAWFGRRCRSLSPIIAACGCEGFRRVLCSFFSRMRGGKRVFLPTQFTHGGGNAHHEHFFVQRICFSGCVMIVSPTDGSNILGKIGVIYLSGRFVARSPFPARRSASPTSCIAQQPAPSTAWFVNDWGEGESHALLLKVQSTSKFVEARQS